MNAFANVMPLDAAQGFLAQIAQMPAMVGGNARNMFANSPLASTVPGEGLTKPLTSVLAAKGGLTQMLPVDVSVLGEIDRIVLDQFVKVLDLPMEVIEQFFEIVNKVAMTMPVADLMKPQIMDLHLAEVVLDIFGSLNPTELMMFDQVLTRLLPLEGLDLKGLPLLSGDGILRTEGILAGSPAERLIEGIKDVLTDVLELEVPVARYLRSLTKVLSEFIEMKLFIAETMLDLKKVFSMDIIELPFDVVARLLSMKLHLLKETMVFKTDTIMTIADVAVDLVVTAEELVTDLVDFKLSLLPFGAPGIMDDVNLMELIPVSVFFEMALKLQAIPDAMLFDQCTDIATCAERSVKDIIAVKLAALEFLMDLPATLIDPLLSIPETALDILSKVGFAKIAGLRYIIEEIQKTLHLFTAHTDFYGMIEEFDLKAFTEYSKGMLLMGLPRGEGLDGVQYPWSLSNVMGPLHAIKTLPEALMDQKISFVSDHLGKKMGLLDRSLFAFTE